MFLRRNGISVALGEYLDELIEFVPLLDRLGIPYVVQGHGIDIGAALRQPAMVQRYTAYKSARAILTRSEVHRQSLINIGLPAEIIHVNPGGVIVPETIVEHGPDSANRFIAIGRMVSKKGPIYLIEAFRRAAAENPDITLDYIGDGPYLPALRQFVDATGIGARVRFHGMVSEERKYELIHECGVFLQHSITDPDTGDQEGLPGAIQEAMAYAMPVISTRHAGIPEVVVHGITGWLVDEGDSAGMAKEILSIASNENRIRQAGHAGHARALALYTWEGEKRRLLDALFNPRAKV
jgi:colanic acid/amylovoran biosynthesis glycosyltransferase